MSLSDFVALCSETARYLELVNPEGVGCGGRFYLHEVTCELSFSEMRQSACLKCEIGDPQPHCEAEVYRQMMELQMMVFGIMDATFARDPVDDRLLFLVRIPLHAELKPENLAGFVSQMALQVHEWQTQVLAGKLIDYEREFEKMLHGMSANRKVDAGLAA
jgi:hypothetical protein